MPSRQFFKDKNRPGSTLVVPACKQCNHSTASSEQVVAALARAIREWTGVGLDGDRTESMLGKGLAVNNPDVLAEWSCVTLRQKRRLRKLCDATGLAGHPLNLGPITRYHLQAFGAKLGCALHWNETGYIIPAEGGVVVSVISTPDLIGGWRPPPEVQQLLGAAKTLSQGAHSVADQFQWASASTPQVGLHIVDCGSAFALNIFTAEEAETLQKLPGAHVHQPGCFTGYRTISSGARFKLPL